MFKEKWTLVFCLVLVVCCLFGNLYRLGAAPQETPRPARLGETQSDMRVASQPATDINSDFCQTIIRNNLFAPLGTVLNPKPNRGANLQHLTTRVYPSNPVAATAWIQNTATGEHRKVFLGDSMDELMITSVQPKQVRLQREGKTVILHLATDIFLNTQRR